MKALQSPRWEDYEYEQIDAEDNVLYWLGDGQTWAEKTQQGDSKSVKSSVCMFQGADKLHYRSLVSPRGIH